MFSSEDIENYVIEIILRLKTIQYGCRKLLANEFASQCPLLLTKIISRICRYLEEAVIKIYQSIDKEADNFEEEVMTEVSELKHADFLIRYISEHLRYIDGAVTRKLPWSIIKPFEKLFESVIPGILFMFRPQWKYNYSIVTDDLKDYYYEMLEEFEDYTESTRKDVFTDFKKPFHIISFPSIERKNILLHCLVGHELGHLIVRKNEYIDQKLVQAFTMRIIPEINIIIKEKYSKHVSGLDISAKSSLIDPKEELQNSIIVILQIWKRGLEEILSDIIGTLIFGPAMLFSMYELSLQKKMDHMPDYINNFYPPWRYRLRQIIEVLQRPLTQFFPIPAEYFPSTKIHEKINTRFELIRNLTEKKDDMKIIKQDPLVKIVYREIEKDLEHIINSTNYFTNELKKKALTSSRLYKDIEHLVIRLRNGITPNAVEFSVEKRRPAELVEIINASWFYKITSEKKLLKDNVEIDTTLFDETDTLNRLTLKAIEYSDIEMEYKREKEKNFKRKRKTK
jgi:hypothetical protein